MAPRPSSPTRVPEARGRDQTVIVLCNPGYAPSLAAASLRALGLDTTDVIGGVEAWAAAGLSVQPCRSPSAEEAAGLDR